MDAGYAAGIREHMKVLAWISALAPLGRVALARVGARVRRERLVRRALALAHACGIWAVATVEVSSTAAAGLAAAAPLLVLARFRLRLRALWDVTASLGEASRRIPAWSTHPAATLDAVTCRADALADLLGSIEGTDPKPMPTGTKLVPGALVLQRRRGVTVAFATVGSQVLVGGFGQPSKPYVRVAASFVTPVAVPPEIGRVFVRAPSDLPAV